MVVATRAQNNIFIASTVLRLTMACRRQSFTYLLRIILVSMVGLNQRTGPMIAVTASDDQTSATRHDLFNSGLPSVKARQKHLSHLHIINLDKDAVRWKSVTAELASKGVYQHQIYRIPGVYGKELSKTEMVNNSTRVARHFCTKGTIGCYLSHRNFWQRTVELSDPNKEHSTTYQVVLEDDVIVADDFMTKIESIIQELDNCNATKDGNWDVVLLGALGCVHPEGKYGFNRVAAFMAGGGRKPRQVTEHCFVPRRPMGMHAYLLSERGAKKLLRQAWYASGHVDVVAWGIQNIDILCVHPMLANQSMSVPSTIGAVTEGLETRLPKFVLDRYTGITFEWAFNAPVLRFGSFVLTMGRSILYIFGIYILCLVFKSQLRWLLPLHSLVVAALVVITKLTTMPHGNHTE